MCFQHFQQNHNKISDKHILKHDDRHQRQCSKEQARQAPGRNHADIEIQQRKNDVILSLQC